MKNIVICLADVWRSCRRIIRIARLHPSGKDVAVSKAERAGYSEAFLTEALTGKCRGWHLAW